MTKGQRNKKRFMDSMGLLYGFKPDRWGHYVVTCTPQDRIYRFKMKKTCVRVEYKLPSGTWVKHHTKFYSRLCIDDYHPTLSTCTQP